MNLAHYGVVLVVAAAAAAELNVVEVLARFGDKVRNNAERMPSFTCSETIERQYYRAKLLRPATNCDSLAGEKRRRSYKLNLERTDRLHVDVRSSPNREFYSWPQADRFEDRELFELIGYGPAASGAFAMSLQQLVQGDATDFTYIGETSANNTKLFQYGFRVPEDRSHFSIATDDGELSTGWDGTLLIDPETAEPVRLTTRTMELPPQAFACEINSAAEYENVSLGEHKLLLPRETRQRFIYRSGEEVEAVVTFSGCREFKAASAVRFGLEGLGTDGAASPAAKPSVPALVLPEKLPVSIDLTSRIDSATAGGGDRFTGRLAKPIVDLDNHLLVEKGAVISGRLEKVAFQVRPAEVAIVLRVETVQIGGVAVPIHLTGKERVTRAEWIWQMMADYHVGMGGAGGSPANSTGGGVSSGGVERHAGTVLVDRNALIFPGASKVLEPGFRTEWITIIP